jgi:choline dehydrogenase-like flavoprotein
VQGYLKQLEGREPYNDDGTESSHAYVASFYYDKPHKNFPKGYHIIIDSGSRVYKGNPTFATHVPGFGSSFKQTVRARSTGLVSLYSQNGMIASPERYMELDPTVKDIYGLAVPKIHFSMTTEDKAIHQDALEKIATLIEASGGVVTNVNQFNGVDSVHWVGTMKMGNDPKTSVLNTYLQSHDVPNLYVADGSGFIDFSEKNPTLTVMALASRCGDYLYEKLKGRAV